MRLNSPRSFAASDRASSVLALHRAEGVADTKAARSRSVVRVEQASWGPQPDMRSRLTSRRAVPTQPVRKAASQASVVPHMPGLQLVLSNHPPEEAASPRGAAAARLAMARTPAKLEHHRRVEQMYRAALQRRAAAAHRSSDGHMTERFLALEPPSVLLQASATVSRPPDALFRDPDHDSPADPFFLTATAEEASRQDAQDALGVPGGASSARGSDTPRAASAPQRHALSEQRVAEAVVAAAAIRLAIGRHVEPRCGPPSGAVASAGAEPLHMGSVVWRYPTRAARKPTIAEALFSPRGRPPILAADADTLGPGRGNAALTIGALLAGPRRQIIRIPTERLLIPVPSLPASKS